MAGKPTLTARSLFDRGSGVPPLFLATAETFLVPTPPQGRGAQWNARGHHRAHGCTKDAPFGGRLEEAGVDGPLAWSEHRGIVVVAGENHSPPCCSAVLTSW